MRIKINGIELEANEEDIQKLLGLGKPLGTPAPVDLESSVPVAVPAASSALPARDALKLLRDSGFTLNTLVMVTRKILKIETSGKMLEDSYASISTAASNWFTRPIKDTFSVLYISPIKMPENKSSIGVVGLNATNQMVMLSLEADSIYGTLNKLRTRGLRSNSVKMVILPINDEIDDAVVKIFPEAKIQRDWGSVIDAAPPPIRDDIRELMHQNSAQETISKLKKSKANEFLEPFIDHLLVYFEFDRRLWRVLKTLSNLDRLEQEIRVKTKMCDTPDELNLLTTWAALRLQYHWIKIPVDSPQLNSLRYLRGKIDTGESSERVPAQKSHIRRRPSVQKER